MADTLSRGGAAIFAVTRRGVALAAELRSTLADGADLYVPERWKDLVRGDATTFDGPARTAVGHMFERYAALIMILSTGAAVRLIAPLLSSKRDDPAVLVVDEHARYAMTLCGGHRGGGNTWAARVADALGAEAIVTTASDLAGVPAVELIGAEWGWRLEASEEAITATAAAAVNDEPIAVWQESGEREWQDDLPRHWRLVDSLEDLVRFEGFGIAVTDRLIEANREDRWLIYRPRTLTVGVGCTLNASELEVEAHVHAVLRTAGLAAASVDIVGTIDRRSDHPAITGVARALGASVQAFSADELASVPAMPNPSDEVARFVGTPGVCEPAAVLASGGGELLVTKQRSACCTVAVARKRATAERAQGSLSLVGLGPGALDLMTPRTRRALREAQDVVGYGGYVDPLADVLPGRRLHRYPLGQEIERTRAAIDLAARGRRVALVSSGDAGVYGMAGLGLELLGDAADANPNSDQRPRVEVIPGVTAANAAAALLGAPLMLDYAVVSLSDALVPWETIEGRLTAVAAGDFVVVLYNPASERRREPLRRARQLLLAHRSPTTPVGVVREAYRPGQSVTIVDLASLLEAPIDMKTVLVVGNSTTERRGKWMVTPRGYRAPVRERSG